VSRLFKNLPDNRKLKAILVRGSFQKMNGSPKQVNSLVNQQVAGFVFVAYGLMMGIA
jgi:hypothetical protein